MPARGRQPIFSVMKKILFVCTGNYYRSRFAEIVFNHLAAQHKIQAVAFSRGLRLNPQKNTEVISPHVPSFLSELNIPLLDPGISTKIDLKDLYHADLVIVLDEKEHRPMVRSAFPDWEHKVTYWSFEDDYLVSPNEVLPQLKEKVSDLLMNLHRNNGHTASER